MFRIPREGDHKILWSLIIDLALVGRGSRKNLKGYQSLE
jgi:hypothetical protein